MRFGPLLGRTRFLCQSNEFGGGRFVLFLVEQDRSAGKAQFVSQIGLAALLRRILGLGILGQSRFNLPRSKIEAGLLHQCIQLQPILSGSLCRIPGLSAASSPIAADLFLAAFDRGGDLQTQPFRQGFLLFFQGNIPQGDQGPRLQKPKFPCQPLPLVARLEQ